MEVSRGECFKMCFNLCFIYFYFLEGAEKPAQLSLGETFAQLNGLTSYEV